MSPNDINTQVNMRNNFPEPEKSNLLLQIMEYNSFKWAAGGLSLLLFVSVIGFSYTLGVRDVNNGAVPIIVSEGDPIKVRPQDPGGKKFAYQDVSVYQNLRKQDENSGEKNDYVLVQNSEKPAFPSGDSDDASLKSVVSDGNFKTQQRQFSVLIKDSKQKDTPQDKKEKTIKKVPLLTEKSDSSKGKLEKISDLPDVTITQPTQTKTSQLRSLIKTQKSAEKPATNPKIQAKQPKKVTHKKVTIASLPEKTIAQKVAPKKTPVIKSKRPFLQVGAYRSNAEAKNAWKKLSANLGSIVKTNQYVIVKANIKNKGTFYRLRVGPYNSKSAALNVCTSLKGRAQGCIFVNQ